MKIHETPLVAPAELIAVAELLHHPVDTGCWKRSSNRRRDQRRPSIVFVEFRFHCSLLLAIEITLSYAVANSGNGRLNPPSLSISSLSLFAAPIQLTQLGKLPAYSRSPPSFLLLPLFEAGC